MTEIATREQGREVSLVPIPAALQDLGVRIANDGAGNRLVLVPASVREKVNVIDPVTSLVQADPNWTPRISVAELNPAKDGPHFYEQAGRKLAPTKQALEILGKAAGILYTRTDRILRAELDDGEIGYRATVGIRRSDGTVEEIRREKVWVEAAERAEVEEAVTSAKAYENNQRTDRPRFDVPGTPTWEAEVSKRWLRELRDRYAKTESKAVLRAIRAALQIPHTFTPAEAAKPFLVIGFNFTPDYDDAEIKRALVAAGLNAQTAFYGDGPKALSAPVETLDLATGELTTPAETPGDAAKGGDSPADRAEQAGDGGTAAQGEATRTAEPTAVAGSSDDDEPEPGTEPAASDERNEGLDEGLKAMIDAAGMTVCPGEKRKGQTLAEAAADGDLSDKDSGPSWLVWALGPARAWNRKQDDFSKSLFLFVEHRAPEIWARAAEKYADQYASDES